ncbi:hypothetical protein BP6252_08863 [Coleophoma cylindrospora]|uniref:Uncharacterized protein n=1 Tax=Coleophoma cylindrospora TaxID=1849047 RepID=A0A3D8R723_9HELO|nr:hypothetical protein BP6252_08863 [Coleophoma cylindrospora]
MGLVRRPRPLDPDLGMKLASSTYLGIGDTTRFRPDPDNPLPRAPRFEQLLRLEEHLKREDHALLPRQPKHILHAGHLERIAIAGIQLDGHLLQFPQVALQCAYHRAHQRITRPVLPALAADIQAQASGLLTQGAEKWRLQMRDDPRARRLGDHLVRIWEELDLRKTLATDGGKALAAHLFARPEQGEARRDVGPSHPLRCHDDIGEVVCAVFVTCADPRKGIDLVPDLSGESEEREDVRRGVVGCRAEREGVHALGHARVGGWWCCVTAAAAAALTFRLRASVDAVECCVPTYLEHPSWGTRQRQFWLGIAPLQRPRWVRLAFAVVEVGWHTCGIGLYILEASLATASPHRPPGYAAAAEGKRAQELGWHKGGLVLVLVLVASVRKTLQFGCIPGDTRRLMLTGDVLPVERSPSGKPASYVEFGLIHRAVKDIVRWGWVASCIS